MYNIINTLTTYVCYSWFGQKDHFMGYVKTTCQKNIPKLSYQGNYSSWF